MRTDDNEQCERREPVCSCVCYCRVLTEDTFELFEQIDGACCHRQRRTGAKRTRLFSTSFRLDGNGWETPPRIALHGRLRTPSSSV